MMLTRSARSSFRFGKRSKPACMRPDFSAMRLALTFCLA
jgi:hypothetical protein